jgi:hypothetical protein
LIVMISLPSCRRGSARGEGGTCDLGETEVGW